MAAHRHWASWLAVVAVAVCGASVSADVINENFNTVTGTGGGPILVGSGFNWVNNWDDGITGEFGFAGTTGFARVGAASAYGAPNGGVNGTGAGILDVTGLTYNMVEEPFDMVTGTGGGLFLVGDGTANKTGYTTNWDNGIYGEAAFAGTSDGAVIGVNGGAVAQGVVGGGVSSGGGRISMSKVTVGAGHWYAGLQWDLGAIPGAAPLYNPNFDEDGMAYWNPWGNALVVPDYDVPTTAHSGTHLLKMWGNFTGGYNNSGNYQILPAQPGQVWQLSAFTQHVSTDSLVGTENHVDMAIEFWDATSMLDSTVTTILNSASATNTWLAAGPIQLTAPAGTTSVRVVFLFVQEDGADAGAGLVDTVTFKIIGGPSGVDLAAHALTANVRGTANTADGQVLGHYQLRLEDSDGDRLYFSGMANGNWQSIGGALNTATEANVNGVPASGVFNVHSPWFRVVVAFDDDITPRWGTGGTLDVDNLLLTNSNSAGSNWYAGLHWSDLLIPEADLGTLRLNADVLGNVPGGAYQLRIEAKVDVSAGIDEAFTTVAGDCGAGGDCIFLDPNDVSAGTTYGFTTDWDSGIGGEGAYGGVYGGTTVWTGGGFSARGLTTGGQTGACGEIRVENIVLGPTGSGWYAGLDWSNQALASTDLSQVILQAHIKGSTASGGTLGKYELRIEDAEGDRMYWQVTANNTWQLVGGALSTATEGPALDGGGDGVFDLDSSSYAVVVSFIDEATSWRWGGVLRVDNLFLTPAVTQQELGRLTFHETATGNWQTAGGLLSEAESTFQNVDENFNTVTGTGGGEFWASGGSVTFGGQPWDDGIEGEETFAGTWGSGTLGTESAYGCTSCGVGGTGAGVVSVTGGAGGGSGGWWAGLTWLVTPPDWSDLSQVFCTAKIKASKLAPFMLRVEDTTYGAANPVWLGFTHTPTTLGFETVGGPLSQAVLGCPSGSCPPFNFNASTYHVTLVMSGSTWDTAWGGAGSLTIDDLFFTGIGFFDADSYTVTLAFDDEVATWGDAGQLRIDNLVLGAAPTSCAGDLNCDGQVSFADINAFVLYLSNYPVWQTTYAGCEPLNGDINGDGTYPSFGDINAFVTLLSTNPLPIMCP